MNHGQRETYGHVVIMVTWAYYSHVVIMATWSWWGHMFIMGSREHDAVTGHGSDAIMEVTWSHDEVT